MTAPRPPQVAPVRRPDLLHPHTTVDVEHGNVMQLVAIRMELLHGANYNDPSPWRIPQPVERSKQR